MESKLFKVAPKEVIDDLKNVNKRVTSNFHRFCVTEKVIVLNYLIYVNP